MVKGAITSKIKHAITHSNTVTQYLLMNVTNAQTQKEQNKKQTEPTLHVKM